MIPYHVLSWVSIHAGMNAVFKSPPWHPSTGGFDPELSFTVKDFESWQSWGMNLVRLGVMWPGVSVRLNLKKLAPPGPVGGPHKILVTCALQYLE
jgi:hypothetical protein